MNDLAKIRLKCQYWAVTFPFVSNLYWMLTFLHDTKKASKSLLFISQKTVKAWMLENKSKKKYYRLLRIYIFSFIDFLS